MGEDPPSSLSAMGINGLAPCRVVARLVLYLVTRRLFGKSRILMQRFKDTIKQTNNDIEVLQAQVNEYLLE